ncbi:dynamin family protein [Actinoplanes sp. G11-F43]|uniref:dynamin family protein n=1 Tax=Actinoplanes sp. G11-F43 TaxID=3424130 RepID=UPI003D32BBCD
MTRNRSFVTQDWAAHRARIVDLYAEVKTIAQLAELDEPADADRLTAAQRLDAARESMLDSAFRIMVFGDFSSGKSTLINALLGHDVLPMRANPTTAFTTEVRWADSWSAELTRFDPERGHGITEIVSLEEFQEAVALRFEDEDSPTDSPYTSGVVQGPVDILRDYVQLIDSAGMNEDLVRESVTLSYLPKVDAVIYVTMAKAAFKQHDRDHYLKMLRTYGHQDIFYVVNQFDELRRPADRASVELRCRAIAKADSPTGDPRIFFTSALDALEARTQESDEDKLRGSGVLELEASVREFLHRSRTMIKIQRPAEVIRQEVLLLRESIRRRREMLSRSSEELWTALENESERGTEIQKTIGRIGASLLTWLERTESLVQQRTEAFLRQKVAEVPSWAKQAPRAPLLRGRVATAEHLSTHLQVQLSQAMQEFSIAADGIGGLMEEREDILQQDLLPLIKQFTGHMAELERALTGSAHTVDEETLRGWLAGLTTYAALRPDPNSTTISTTGVVSGLMLGGGGAAYGTAALVGTTSAAALATVAAPLVVAAIAIPLIVRQIGRRRARAMTAESFAEELSRDARSLAEKYARELAVELRGRTDAMSTELESRFSEMLKEAKDAVGQARTNKDGLLEVQQRLARWERSLNDIDKAVSGITHAIIGSGA